MHGNRRIIVMKEGGDEGMRDEGMRMKVNRRILMMVRDVIFGRDEDEGE